MTDPRIWLELKALYGSAPVPDLDTCPLFYIHIDERGTSVTFGFETQQLPPHPKPEWSEQAYNTFRFWIEFTGVTNLRVSGIRAETKRAVRIIAGDRADDLQVSVNSETRSIIFSAVSSRVSHTRVYLQGAL
ncbi:Imm50 family immunity protein [Streptomyces sp. NBC_00207]|uniref:Imm50 family immunity protein n=1 Tax=Streptomyces sp. NBC_00207 TaxID=2903635 RepID=UPI003243B93F